MPISADLGKPREAFVEELVKSGRYGSKSEVLREGVRLVQEREAKARALDALLAPALADAEAGNTSDLEEVFDELLADIEEMDRLRDAS